MEPQADSATSQAHSGKIETDSGHTVQKQTSDLDRVVPHTGGLRPLVYKLAHSHFFHQVQSQTFQVCVPSTGSAGLAGGCSQPKLGWGRCLYVPSCISSGQASLQNPRSGILQVGPHCPRWPNMPWFWDLVNMSVQVPLSLPHIENLLTRPFSQCPHRDLLGLNWHDWLLEPLAYRCKDSLMKWQHELRLLRDSQPELSMNQSGPYL